MLQCPQAKIIKCLFLSIKKFKQTTNVAIYYLINQLNTYKRFALLGFSGPSRQKQQEIETTAG